VVASKNVAGSTSPARVTESWFKCRSLQQQQQPQQPQQQQQTSMQQSEVEIEV
jgi:hypothetical protein